MRAIRWCSTVVVVAFLVVIVNGWQHDHYSLVFVALVGVGLLASWLRGYTDAVEG